MVQHLPSTLTKSAITLSKLSISSKPITFVALASSFHLSTPPNHVGLLSNHSSMNFNLILIFVPLAVFKPLGYHKVA
ncbi:hypothetical protein L195_g035109 [Trifolium pratense]|uniref:Uncharacterized protein n=1 Tax=Trifolium pratense TaxID=57577 RepID=A0A2K3LKQ9_TRIPR|nr:hypothetical protein L195_g035109 [Trifolium pratense]